MSKQSDGSLPIGLPRFADKAKRVALPLGIDRVPAFLRSLGAPAIISFLGPVVCLPGIALVPSLLWGGLFIGAVLFMLGTVFFCLYVLRRHRALKYYRSGAFHRLAAVHLMASAHSLFLFAQGYLWAGLAFILVATLFIALGATFLSYGVAGGLLAVGWGHLLLTFWVKRSVFQILCCKEDRIPDGGLVDLVRYGLMPDSRLNADQRYDHSGLGSLLAVIDQDDAKTDGVALRIPEFGNWPGLSLVREGQLRLKASWPLFGIGACAGLLTAVFMLVVLGLPHADGTSRAASGVLNPFAASSGRFEDHQGDGESAGNASKLEDIRAQGGRVDKKPLGTGYPSSAQGDDRSAQGNQSDKTGDQASTALSDGTGPEGGAQAEQQTQDNKSTEAETDKLDMPQNDISGMAPSSDYGRGAGGGAGAGAEASPQGLSEQATALPDASGVTERIDVDLLAGKNGTDVPFKGEAEADGADDGREAFLHGQQGRESNKDSGPLTQDRSGSLHAAGERGANGLVVKEVHAKPANRDTNKPSHPHIPVQQVPNWMRSLLEQQSQ